MSDKDECMYRNSPTAREMLLPLHVEPSADPVSGGDTPTKRPTLSPVLLSPGSTTQKLIASGKIKNCIILLQKTSLDHNSLAKFADKSGSALDDETVTGQTELTDTDAKSALGNHECYQETELEATNLPETELETTNLPDHGTREEEPDTTKCDSSAVNRNIFTSFLNEFRTQRQLNYNTSDSPQMDSTPRTILAEETNPVTSTNTLDQLTDLDRREGEQFQSDDLMSISSTGSSDTIEYPKCDEEDASERSDIIDNGEYDGDELEIQAATDSENGAEELGDEPPRLERLESLAETHYSFDNSLLSPPLLTSIRDDTERERYPFSISLSLQGKEVSPNAPSNGDAHGVDIESAESPVGSSACSTEIPENQPPPIPAQTEPSGRSQSGLTSTAHDAVLLRSSSGTTGHIERNENQPLTSDHDHRRQIDLTNVINDVFLSHSSSVPVNTTLSNVGTSRRTLRDWIQRDQCVEAEIQETLQQIVNTSKDTAEYESNASQEVMYSADSPLADSAVSIQIAEVVSLSENTSIAGQELPEGPEEPVRDIVPDGPVFIGVAEEQVGSMASPPDPSTYSCSQCVDIDPNNSDVDAGEFSAVATSVHSSLSDINSETEIERAVASISDSRQLEADRAQDICENIFDGNIQVAEVVIDTHADDSESSANGVGIMFSLDRRTSTDEEKDRVRSRDEISNDKTSDQRDDPTKDNDAQNIVLAIQSPSASSKENTPPLTEKGQEGVASKFPSALEVGRNSNENSPVVPSADFGTPEQCPDDKETQTGNQKDEFPVAESDTETESTCSDDEEKIYKVSDSVATEPRVLESQICGEEVCDSQKVTDSSTRGGALSHTSQEMPQSKQLSFEIHDHGSRVPVRNDESIAIGTGEEMRTDAVETISLVQDVATPTSDRNTHEAGSETSFNRGADDASRFAPSRSQEMDTAISLALMSEMTEAQQQRSAGDQLSGSQTPQTTTLSSLTPAVHQDNGAPADMRIRHLSASQIPDSSHGEGNSASNAYTSLRPNSAHGVATQNGAISTEAQVGSQQATVRGSRGRPRGRGSSGFAIVDYSSSVPPQAGNFEELKWRLVQDRRLNSNPEQQINVSQQAASPYLPPWALTGSQRELNAPRGKGRHEVVSMQTGVPIEFPDGKRFIAYNKEALNYQPMNFLKRQAGWQTKAQTHSSRVPNEDNSGTSQFRGAVQAVTPQVPQNAPQHFQLSQSTIAPGLEVHNANQQTAGAVNTHPRPPFPSASQMLRNLQSPRTASGVFIGEYSTHWQQPHVSSAYQGPSLPTAHVNDVPSHLPQRVTHAPDQSNAVNSLGLGLGTHSYQESIRAAHGVQGGDDRTGLLNTRRAVQPPGNVLQTASDDESGQVLVQNEQIGPAGGRGQTSKAVAATDSFRQSTNRHSTTQLRSGCADGATAKRQTTAANGQDLEYPMDSYVVQQQLFLRARGFDIASNEQTAEHEVDKTTPAYRQHKDVSQEHTPRDTEQQYLTTSNITSVQSAEMRTVTPTNNFPRNILLSGRNLATRPEQNEKSAPPSTLVDRRDVVRPAVSASLYIANQADASTQRAINPNVYQNRELAPQVQSIHVGAGSYQTAMSGGTGNAENHLHRGHLFRDFNRNASHRPAGQVPASVDYLSAKTPFEMKAPGPGSRQDHAPMKDIPTSDEWDVAKEQALLKSLPPELANYVIGQRREGTPIAEALKAILTSLLEEESGETRRAREQEARGQKQRVWRSTIHYRSSEAEPHSGTVTNVTSQDGIYPIPLRHPTQTADVLAEDCRSFPRENLTSQPQYGQTLELSAGVRNSDGNQRLDCLTQNPKNGSTTRFYNPPPLVRPLYKADIPLDTRTVEPQRDSLYSPENSDSAIDLRTQRLAATTSLDHCGAVYSEEHPIDTQYLIPNNSLYHRAYTAGELGPIRASSLINLSTQTMPPLTTPFMQQNLSSTQLLIRNKLLERRSRLQSLSISTPDIVHGYSYPVKRKRKNVLKPSAQTDMTSHTANPAPPSLQVNEDTRPNVGEISSRSITAPYPTVQAVSSAGGNAQRQMYCKDVVSDHTTYSGQEAESDTLVQYPKLKSDLQSRWVTESVQPQARKNNAHIQQADNLQTRGTTIADPSQRGEVGNVPSAPEQTGTSNLTKSTISHSTHQANYFSSDPSTVTTSDLQAEKIPDSAVQPLAMSGERSGRPKGSKPHRKRGAGETSTGYNFHCQFCEFKSCFLSDIRSHVKQAHFDKYRKNGAPKRSKSEKSRAVADKMSYIDLVSSVPASGIATKKNQAAVMSDVQNSLNNELTVSSKGQKGGSDSSQMTNSFTKTTSSVVVVSPPVAPEQVMTAHAPHTERLTGETRAAESVSLASHPTVTGNSTAKPSPDGAQHAEEQQLHCSHCNLPCKDAKELHIHVKFQHTNTKGLPLCFNCGYTAKSNYGLRKHILKWHAQSKGDKYKCTHADCNESFVTEEELQRHLRSHNTKKNYSCDLCDAKYQYLTGLKYHQVRHKLSYPHECKQCGLKFKSVGMLNRHEFQRKHFSS